MIEQQIDAGKKVGIDEVDEKVILGADTGHSDVDLRKRANSKERDVDYDPEVERQINEGKTLEQVEAQDMKTEVINELNETAKGFDEEFPEVAIELRDIKDTTRKRIKALEKAAALAEECVHRS
jgi:restriction endonuclease S subunit